MRVEPSLDPVARTLLIPLWARAVEADKRRPMVEDPRAAQVCRSIDYDFSIFRRAYGTQLGCVVRGLLFDEWVADFLRRHPDGTVVELGAGLSTRFERVDNGRAQWIDVDVAGVIELRRRLLPHSKRRELIAADITDSDLLRTLRSRGRGPRLFISEGVLMYLEERDVRALASRIADTFAPTEYLIDAIAPSVVRNQRLHDTMRHMMDAPFRWGIEDIGHIATWDPRFVLEETASLPEIASRFPGRVPLHLRAIASIIGRALPRFAAAYRLGRIVMRG
jgi:O-methyltransferase involved in polyketide biosynthesis